LVNTTGLAPKYLDAKPRIRLNDSTTADDTNDTTKSKIFVSAKALSKMMYYLSTFRTEFGFAMSGYRHGPRQVYVTDIYVPSQKVTGSYWEQVPLNGIDDVFLHYKDNPERQVGWGHSHCDFGAFHSGTDSDTTKEAASQLKLPVASLTISRHNPRRFDGKLAIKNRSGRIILTAARIILPFDPSDVHIVESDGLDSVSEFLPGDGNSLDAENKSVRGIIKQIKDLITVVEDKLDASETNDISINLNKDNLEGW
jgi:hypothetical protein